MVLIPILPRLSPTRATVWVIPMLIPDLIRFPLTVDLILVTVCRIPVALMRYMLVVDLTPV